MCIKIISNLLVKIINYRIRENYIIIDCNQEGAYRNHGCNYTCSRALLPNLSNLNTIVIPRIIIFNTISTEADDMDTGYILGKHPEILSGGHMKNKYFVKIGKYMNKINLL